MEKERPAVGSGKVVAVYCRVSKREEGESRSIENQRCLARDRIAQDEVLSQYRICYFSDDGYTGTNMNRPAVKKLLAGIFSGKIQALLVKDFSRLSRDHLVLAELLENIFLRYPVRVISIADHFDSDHDRPGLENGIKNLFYEYYCRDISNKTKKALQVKRQNGKGRTGKCPFGYERDPQGQLMINPVEAEIVRKIFDLCLEQKNCPEIAEQMAKENNMRRWSAAVVWRMLHDPVYVGQDLWHKSESIYRNGFVRVELPKEKWNVRDKSHPAIIDREVYEKIKTRYPETGGENKKRRKRHMFHGITKCGMCGMALCRHRNRAGLLICNKHPEQVQIAISCLWKILREIFDLNNENNEKSSRIFMKIFVQKIFVDGRNIRIQAKVIIENDLIL